MQNVAFHLIKTPFQPEISATLGASALNAPAVFASVSSPAVRANTAAPAVFASASLSAVRANTAAPAVFALASYPAVRANTAAPAVFAFGPSPAVQATTMRWNEALLFASPSCVSECVHIRRR